MKKWEEQLLNICITLKEDTQRFQVILDFIFSILFAWFTHVKITESHLRYAKRASVVKMTLNGNLLLIVAHKK